jgi:Golgi phosphoprotein 3 (GPP34)
MAQIAEDLFLLLLDTSSLEPALERERRERVLAAAVLLDLAFACRVRPAVSGESVEPGRLMALAGGAPTDPVVVPAYRLLHHKPLSPDTAVSKLRKGVQDGVAAHLERLGQISEVRGPARLLRSSRGWQLADRERVGLARAALTSALFDREPPTPATAGIVTVLHWADGLGALLSLNDRGWRWVHARASEIASGSWVHEYPTAMPEMNLAVTASALRSALS